MSGEFRQGSLVAGYRLEAQVGAGGMAVVWQARDERLGRLVALKIPAPALGGYPGQQGIVTVRSITVAADGALLAAGTADGHPAIWRRGAGGAWKLVSASSPAVSALPGALTGIAHGREGWIAVGGLSYPDGQQPVAMISGDGVNWRVSGATFLGNHPVITAVAAGPGGYVVVGTQLSSRNRANRIAALWWSAGPRGWKPGNNDYGKDGNGRNKALDGHYHPSSVSAVASAGTFVAVGAGYGASSAVCAVWTAVAGRGSRSCSGPPGAWAR